MVNIKSLKLGVNVDATIEITGGRQSGKITFTETGTGSVNNTTKEMLMNMGIEMDIPLVGKQSATMDTYLTGGFMYVKASVAGQGQWIKMKVDESGWAAQNQFAQEVEFLKSATNITRLADENIGSFDCYVFQIVPDMTALMKWAQSQQQSNTTSLKNLNPNMFKTTSLKMWIDKKSLLPQKENINLTIEMTPANVGVPANGTSYFDKMTMTMSGEVICSDYNIPVTINLPAAAQNARETPQINQ